MIGTMVKPVRMPVGLRVARSSKAIGYAFNAALAEAGGSLPVWLVLSSLTSAEWPAQVDLAKSLGIEGATLTRHLDALEEAGLVRRRRDPEDRRAVRLELTDEGRALHAELLSVVIAFDKRLRTGLTEAELGQLDTLLTRLEGNVRREDPLNS
jgi:MarR family transcriptional regulator for hemolysin